MIKLTELNGDPVYVAASCITAVRWTRRHETSSGVKATQVEFGGIGYHVREPVETVIALVEGEKAKLNG